MFKKHIKIAVSSRTDSGVHALCNVVSFKANSSIPISRLPRALNSVLPKDIRVVEAQEVRSNFNARYDIRAKEYEYLIYNGETLNPLFRNFVWHVKPKLNLPAVRKAAKHLIGKRDFSSFCASGSSAKDFVCTIYGISIIQKKLKLWDNCELPVISLRFRGNRFLYKMVRNMVGALVGPAKRCAPPQGLCLIKTSF